MKFSKSLFLFFLLLMSLGCASTKSVKQNTEEKTNEHPLAVDHYLTGALYDFQDQYEKALLEYYQALLYDSTSSQILKAIGRDLIRTRRFESAKQYLERSLKYNAEDKETLYYMAEAFFNMKDYENSIIYFEKLWEFAPLNPSVERNLIYLYTSLGKIDELINFYERILEVHGYESEAVYELFTLYLKANKIDEAQNLMERMVKVDPSRADNWVFLGNINEMRGDTTKAIDAYQKALDLTSDNEKALYQIYQLYRSTENWSGLVSTFSKILEKDPANSDVRLILAEGLYYQKNYERVNEILQPLLDLENYQSQAYRLLGMIASEEENFSEAEKYFKKITEINPKNKFGWLSLAYVYNQQGHFNRSVFILQDAIAHLPDDVDILGLYGSTLNQVKKYDEALKILKGAYQKDSKNLNIIISLGVVYEELKMYTESDSLHEKALKLYPDEALLLNNYSYSLGVRGTQLTRALEMAERAVQMDSTNGAYLDTIGWIHFKLGNFEQAKNFILRALSHRENSAEVIEHLGDVYYKLGDLDKAREYWQHAFDLEPENDVLKKKLDNNEI